MTLNKYLTKISPETVRHWTRNLSAKQKEKIENQLGDKSKKPKSPIRQNRFTMNKLEKDFKEYLILYYKDFPNFHIGDHDYKLKLGNGAWYEPDLYVAYKEGLIWFYETKNPNAKGYQAGIKNVKIAATQYPWHKFFLVLRDGENWSTTEILR